MYTGIVELLTKWNYGPTSIMGTWQEMEETALYFMNEETWAQEFTNLYVNF